ncbi:aminodeoxychorismate lyase [Methylobacillus gramineus]|uniref:aminodeoxychorismate lyase n=1 Tax=Methylobacillus gramineus TaxID=755169 RepID=UPI001CFFA6F4|nr:aminodeoxychorismate lyase [Methylobacillus gramineus]MCB5184347.1 aminodeoxychorismate lyase [Methylobacillus gramineus]
MSLAPSFLINGQPGQTISPMDRGFAYGDGIFRTIRVKAGRPDAWALHYAKLRSDCVRLGIGCPAESILLAEVRELFADAGDGVAKITITRGQGERGYMVNPEQAPTRIVMRTQLPEYPARNFDLGITAHLCRTRLSHQPLLAGVKHLNRLENVLARQEWTDPEISEGVLLDENGWVIEGVMSNIVARSGKMLATPDLSHCGVAGITRQRIIDSAPELGYELKIGELSLSGLMAADEFIMCNSLYGAWQVVKFNGRTWPVLGLAANLRQILQD